MTHEDGAQGLTSCILKGKSVLHFLNKGNKFVRF